MVGNVKEGEETPVAEEDERIPLCDDRPQCSKEPDMSKGDRRLPKIDFNASTIAREECEQSTEATDCAICHNERFQEPTAAQHDKRLLKPCFCNFYCHHGCMRDVLREHKKCSLCGVQYRVIEYGTICDFFSRYWYQYACCALSAAAFLSVAFYGLFAAFTAQGEFGILRYFLVVICAVVLLIVLFCVGGCCRNTLHYRLRRFRDRYSEVTIFDYKPDKNNKGSAKPSKTEFETLNRVESGLHGLPADVTVGQYLLGHKGHITWQQSSTPLDGDNQPVRFTFDTPMNDLDQQKTKKSEAGSSSTDEESQKLKIVTATL